MKISAHVICLREHEHSQMAAYRCYESARRHGLKVSFFEAWEPRDDPLAEFKRRRWPAHFFLRNPYSRPAPCMACFLSHADLWLECAENARPMIILEHDAVMTGPLPSFGDNDELVNLGKPSFGRYHRPRDGIGPLASKPYFPGAHAYYVTARAAMMLYQKARTEAQPTDVFLSIHRFPFAREAHPWPFVACDWFTTVQNETGCAAKHNAVKIV